MRRPDGLRFFFTQKRTSEREEAARGRAICISKTRRMPEQFVTFGDVKKAADRTLKEMGINPQDEWRNYSFSDAGDDLALP
ncbi:PerC family transcriptional regulator [Escherichia coli]|nr:PerC family transcriptional regulator [Escherichia coli]MCV5584852.1 PerC family transcriptional regulator [Escherichia coli]